MSNTNNTDSTTTILRQPAEIKWLSEELCGCVFVCSCARVFVRSCVRAFV